MKIRGVSDKTLREYLDNPNRCGNCGKPILPQDGLHRADNMPYSLRKRNYCGHSCAAKKNNLSSHFPKRQPKVKICTCGIEYTGPKKICDECTRRRQNQRQETLDARIKKNTRTQAIAKDARNSVKSRVMICQRCGYDKHVDCCHIKAIKDFSDDTLVSDINKPSNLIMLCRNCHWEFDRGWVAIGDVPQQRV